MTPPFDRSADPHPDDGVLLALLDREREDMIDEARDAGLGLGRRHLEQCDDCRGRLAAIAAQSGQVRDALAFIHVRRVTADEFLRCVAAASTRRVAPRGRPTWQAAAVALALAGAAAAATGPIRAWVRHRPERAPTDLRSPVKPPATPTAQPADRSGATVSFAATGPLFTVRFDSLPESGVLTVDSTTAGEISARVVSGADTGGDAMVVLPAELHVRNSTRSRASYAVSVPSAVTRLRVIVAGRTVFDGATRVRIDLHRAR